MNPNDPPAAGQTPELQDGQLDAVAGGTDPIGAVIEWTFDNVAVPVAMWLLDDDDD